MNLVDYKGVWVVCETLDGEVLNVSYELISEATKLAKDLDTEVTALLLGSNVEKHAQELIHYGADNVLVVDDVLLENYITEPFTKVISNLIEDRKPAAVLIGATAAGRDLAPRVSARVATGLTADCMVLEIEPETKDLWMTRPSFGGNIMATIICPDHRPQMATVRPGVMQINKKDTTKTGNIEIIESIVTKEDVNVEIIDIIKNEGETVNIAEASVLVSAGRGIGSKENFKPLEEVASLLGGTVSCSRSLVDSGMFEHDRQVGQTGTTVRPNLYIACGISGAIQHVAGMEGADFIVSINKNEDAPIFDVSDLSIVGDVNQIMPAVLEELKNRLNK